MSNLGGEPVAPRSRALWAIGASVLAVAAIAVAVPLLRGDAETRPVGSSGDAPSAPTASTEASPSAAASSAPREASEPAGHGSSALPGNVLDWPGRGAESDVIDDMHRAYARSRGDGAPETSAKVLFASDDDSGTRFVLAQMWVPGDERADTVGYVASAYAQPELQLKARLAKDAAVVAMLVPRSRGQENDTLVVVPRPGAGQVEYAADGRSFRRVGESQDYLDGVVLVDRAPTADADQVRVLDGDGRVLFEGPVRGLLCGAKGCGSGA